MIEPTLILILSDINTPGIDGLAAGGNQTETPRPAGDDQRRRRTSALDAFEFVNNPVDFDHLKAGLRKLPSGFDRR